MGISKCGIVRVVLQNEEQRHPYDLAATTFKDAYLDLRRRAPVGDLHMYLFVEVDPSPTLPIVSAERAEA